MYQPFHRWTLLTCCTLLPTLTQAWGPHRSAEFPITPNPSFEEMYNYPLQKELDWSVKTTYLIVHPHEEDIDYADKLDVVPQSGIPTSTNLHIEDPNFGWWSGFRLGFGRFLPNNDKWDVNLAMTYVYSNNEDKTTINSNDTQLLYTGWSINTIGTNLSKAEMSWRLNYFTWDIDVGRYYRLKQTFFLHPHIGLRAALIDIDYKSSYTKQSFLRLISGNTLILTNKDKFSADQDFWGIGPRIGSDFSFGMKYHWSIVGNLALSLLYGHDKVKQKIDAELLDTSFNFFPVTQHLHAHGTPLRTNVEASIGLGWERWVKQETVHLATSFQFEVSEWFSMNSFFNISELLSDPVANDIAVGEVERHHGNLGYYGFSVNLQVDF